MSDTFLSITDSIGVSKTFLVFMVIAIITLVFVILFVPETKGISLEKPKEMLHDLYMEKNKGKKWSSLCYILRKHDSNVWNTEYSQGVLFLLKNF